MARSTHGPWIWEEGQPHIFREWNGKRWRLATVEGADLGWHEDRNSAGRESGANALLIAAAPTLAEHLHAVVCQLEAASVYISEPVFKARTLQRIEDARAVLTAAGVDLEG